MLYFSTRFRTENIRPGMPSERANLVKVKKYEVNDWVSDLR
jgi:hypothetical protein